MQFCLQEIFLRLLKNILTSTDIFCASRHRILPPCWPDIISIAVNGGGVGVPIHILITTATRRHATRGERNTLGRW